MGRLIQPLAAGHLDVIGDIHGEREALEALLAALGYDQDGRHPDARRLVFVGDLCDRGPDSPGVIRRVRSLVNAGRAQAVCGNHELNLLRLQEKHGNHWFYGKSFDPEFGPCVAISSDEQEPILRFLRSLPIALERRDLRIVHAAWLDSAINRCRAIDAPVDEAYESFDLEMRCDPVFRELEASHTREMHLVRDALKNSLCAPVAHAIGPYDEHCQMQNPIRIITSGVERATDRPFFSSGKWRYVDRVAWWREYDGDVPVLFGHYWRWWDPAVHIHLSKGEPHLFADDEVGPYMADHHRTFCVDFSAGARYKERRGNHTPPFQGRLAAIRWPERELVFDAEAPVSLDRLVVK